MVADAILRLKSLTGPSLEFILVDDGSTDDTAQQMRLGALGDERFRVIEIPINGGLGAARRAGFEAAAGNYVWNVDVDDDWPSDALAVLQTAVGADLLIVDAVRQRMDGSRELVNRAPLPPTTNAMGALERLLQGHITGHLWNKLVRRAVLDRGDIFTDARIHSDLVMLLKLLPLLESVATDATIAYTYIERAGSNITSRRKRGPGLYAAGVALDRAVDALAPEWTGSARVSRWRAKTLVLSALRDAVRADYPADEGRERFRVARSHVHWRDIARLAPHDSASALQLTVAMVAPSIFKRVVGR
jgi:glycosyltransferase involved in cell wall biosynthesis